MGSLRAGRVLTTVGLLIAALTVGLAPTASAALTVTAPKVQPVSTDALPAFAANGTTMQHSTEVETDTFSWGSTIVSAFQVGRNGGGYGAQAIGWATSTDNGQTWTNGILPGLSASSPTDPNSTYPVVVNQSVAYDAKLGTWLIPSVGYVPTSTGKFHEKALLVSTSSDGQTWNDPVTAVPTNADKAWGVCDNSTTSPYYGNCYVAYSQIDSVPTNFLAVVTSSDGGQTWSAPVTVPGSATSLCATTATSACGYNTNPIVQPSGNVVLIATDRHNGQDGFPLISSVSSDGGASFSPPVPIATVHYQVPAGNYGFACVVTPNSPNCLRSKDKPSVDVDMAGTVYVAWSDCQFRAGCAHDDLVYSTSTDGVTWSAPKLVGAPDSGTDDKVIPGFAVAPGTSGSTAQLSAVFYDIVGGSCATTCKVVPQITTSYDGGTTWTPPYSIRTPFPINWLPGAFTNGPRMLGDYLSMSYCNGSLITVMSLPTKAPSTGPVYSESEYALTLPVGFGPPTAVAATAGDASATVRFATPYPISAGLNYQVTAAPNGPTVTGTSPITVANLANGTKYTFTVTVSDGYGNHAVSAPSNGVIPKAVTALTIDPDLQIALGSSTTIHTTLTAVASGQALAGKIVQLQGQPATGGTWTLVRGGQQTTDASGNATVTVAPTTSYRYRWVHPADADSRASTSPTQQVTVS